MTTIYLMRHGQSQANIERIFANSNEGFPLTEEGIRQVEMAARFLKIKKHMQDIFLADIESNGDIGYNLFRIGN